MEDRSKDKLTKVVRPFYFDAVREVIAVGEVDKMKTVLADAKSLFAEQGDLKAAIKKLEIAIKKIEQ